MFNPKFIYELLKGILSEDGYKHILNVVSWNIKKHNWPNSLIVSSEVNSFQNWSNDEIMELTHQFFEWLIVKGKLKYINKVPETYISYYFSQVLVSFVANRISEEQQKQGLSFENCKELVFEIAKKDLEVIEFNGIDYVYNQLFIETDIKPLNEIESTITYLSKIPLTEKTKRYKPLVKMAIEDIFNTTESPIKLRNLVVYVFNLFNQKDFEKSNATPESETLEQNGSDNRKHKVFIDKILSGITKDDARLLSEYIFQSLGQVSYSKLSEKYSLPKSTLHYKIEEFKKKIHAAYTPINEEDGLAFIKGIALSLDKLSN